MARLDNVLTVLVLVHLATCPFTKVEESFNLQATYDLLFHFGDSNGGGLAAFDHHEFPGVVPRTFLGALAVSAISWPFKFVATTLMGLPPIAVLVVVRIVVATMVLQPFRWFCDGVGRRFGRDTSTYLRLVTLSQFHFAFYASRPLPNTFALALALCASSAWIRGQWRTAAVAFTLSTVVFRCDTIVLLGPVVLVWLATRAAGFWELVGVGIASGACFLALTVAVDSIFWRKWLWPEGEVLFFNTVRNKSSEWGTQPYHWYFTSALPRALLGSYVLVPLGLLLNPALAVARALVPAGGRSWIGRWFRSFGVGTNMGGRYRAALLEAFRIDRAMAQFVMPALVFVLLYSILPHKELRFLFPALPLLNLSAASAIAKLRRYSVKKGELRSNMQGRGGGGKNTTAQCCGSFGYACSMTALACSFGASLFFLHVSSLNYPGGHALLMLHGSVHKLTPPCPPGVSSPPKHLHICNLAATTGVSRFGYIPASGPGAVYNGWTYSKREDLVAGESAEIWRTFTHLLTETPELHLDDFVEIGSTEGFDNVDYRALTVRTSPKVFAMMRSDYCM